MTLIKAGRATMQLPHFTNTLLFRISASFLLVIGVGLGSYYLWIENTVFSPYGSDAEEEWYVDFADDQLEDLSLRLAKVPANSHESESLLVDYGAEVRQFEVELVYFTLDGLPLASSDPDSLTAAVDSVSGALLGQMSLEDWDYDEFPDPTHMEAYLNRVFTVLEVKQPDSGQALGYLVVSYFPTSLTADELSTGVAMIIAEEYMFKAVVGLLIYSAITALLIMARTSRRVKRLSDGVHAVATGDLTHRVPARSADEIGTLGRNFNTMAEHLETVMGELRNKEEFQRQLIANVSHDLRTPMASIRGYVETMQIKGPQLDSDLQKRYLSIIDGNLRHLNRLVEHMLVLSRFDSGQATFRMEVFSIVELVDSFSARLEGLVAEQAVQLNIECVNRVGLVRGDPLQIAQVLQNLVENAIKFSEPSDTITINLTCLDRKVTVTVLDTGCGISEADLPRIFDRFFTCNTSRTRVTPNPDERNSEKKASEHLDRKSVV